MKNWRQRFISAIRIGSLARELLDRPAKPSTVKVSESTQFAPLLPARRLNRWTAGFFGPPRKVSMLVLSRKKDESIVINNDIKIVVVEIRGDKVRLGVEAPKEVPVHRQEVFDAIARGESLAESVDAEAGTVSTADDSTAGKPPHAD